MKAMMDYRGYRGSVHYSDEDRVFFGRVEFIRDLVSYEGTDVASLRRAFEEAVDDYLALCEAQEREPDQPFKGTFNVRTGSALHRRAVLYARARGMNLNALVTKALRTYLDQPE